MWVTIISTEEGPAFSPFRVWWFNQWEGKRLGEKFKIKYPCLSANSFQGKQNFTHMCNETRVALLGLLPCLQARRFINLASAIKVSEEKATPWSFLAVPESNSRAHHILRGSVRLGRCRGCFPVPGSLWIFKGNKCQIKCLTILFTCKSPWEVSVKDKADTNFKMSLYFSFWDKKMSFNTMGILWLLSPTL